MKEEEEEELEELCLRLETHVSMKEEEVIDKTGGGGGEFHE